MAIFTFLLIIPILLWAFSTFDNLVKLEFEDYRYYWVKDHQPVGLFWKPEDYPDEFLGGEDSHNYFLRCLFKTPAWVRRSAHGADLLQKYRILVLAWAFVVLLWFCISLRFFPVTMIP